MATWEKVVSYAKGAAETVGKKTDELVELGKTKLKIKATLTKSYFDEMAAKGLFYAGKYTVGTDYPKNAIVEHEGKYYFSLLPTSAAPNVNFSGGALADGKWQALTYEAYYADKAAQADNALKLNGKEESALEVAKAAEADNEKLFRTDRVASVPAENTTVSPFLIESSKYPGTNKSSLNA